MLAMRIIFNQVLALQGYRILDGRNTSRGWPRSGIQPRHLAPGKREACREDGVAPGIEESAGGEFAHLAFIDRRVGEDEAVEVFEHRELGTPDAIADGSGLP